MTNLETAARAALEAMKAVVSGNMGVPRDRRDRTCAHGRFFWEDCGQCVDEHLAPHIAALEAALAAPAGKFRVGARVRKVKGSRWDGTVVGTYSTKLTPEGYAVESVWETGSVQIYPAAALEAVNDE